MVKRVFAIIGIVVGSVAAFVGAVVGVMAAMGKFKTPIVYPTHLEFLNNDEVVIENIPFSLTGTEEPTLYYFELQGTNVGSEHPVNKNVCYIWFDKNVGSDLITLCDENRNPLTKTENNRYQVNCNEPIYYMINKLDDNATTEGKVVLMARSENDKVQPDTPLTIWLDRNVESVFVKNIGDESINQGVNTQNITVGVDISFDFEYKINTPLSLKPISKLSEKEIELYYVATDYSNDYVKVTEAEVNNPSSPLNSILKYENNKFTFTATKSGSHTFKIAVFANYQAKLDYEAGIEGVTLNNPNYDKTTNMVVTTVNINVENIEISKVGFLGTEVVFNLYSEQDYITLDGVSGVENAKNNNLELYMKKGDGPSAVEDTTRFDEVTLNGFASANLENIWSEKYANFVSIDSDQDEVEANPDNMVAIDTIEKSKITLPDNWTIVDHIIRGGVKYYCSNGVAVYREELGNYGEIKLLKPGSYLNFFIQNQEVGSAKYEDLNCESNLLNSGTTKSWNIITKEMPELNAGENLCLGILVVNSRGKFSVDNYFATIPVTIGEVELDYDAVLSSAELDITFDPTTTYYAEKSFEDFRTINGGSYNACVLVAEQDSSYIVNTLSNITFSKGGKTYVLVGYENGGKFVNKVKINENITKDKELNLYMLQLKNGYKQTVNDILDQYLTNGKEFGEAEINNIYTSVADTIVIKGNYHVNKDLLSFKYDGNDLLYGDLHQVYENTDSHTIVITSSNENMLANMITFFGTEIPHSVNYADKLIIDSLTIDLNDPVGKPLEITYSTKACLSDPNTVIKVKLIDIDLELPGVQILSGSPTKIVLKDGDGGSIVLSNTADEARNSANEIRVLVGYESEQFTYIFKINDKLVSDAIFNQTISAIDVIGFQDETDKGQTFEVVYDSTDKQVFNTDMLFPINNLVEKQGTAILNVTIGTTTKYIKVVTDTAGFDMNTNQNFVENKQNLNEITKLTYSSTELALTTSNLVFVDNVKCISYGDGNLIVTGSRTEGWELKKDTTVICTIKDDGNGWTFDYDNAFIPLTISFDVVTVAGSVNITNAFTSSIQVNINREWQDNRVFYAGTKVKLLANSDYSVYKSESTNLTVKINDSYDVSSDNTYTFGVEHIGNISIDFYYNSTKILSFVDFVVKPNVIVTTEVEANFDSETTYAISALYELKAYDTSITYGENENSSYSADNLHVNNISANDLNKLSVLPDGEGNLNPTLTGGETLNIGKQQELEFVNNRKIRLAYSLSGTRIYTINERIINIENKHKVTNNPSGENSDYTYKALKEYDIFATVADFGLVSIKADNLTFNINSGKFTIATIVNQVLENVDVLLTYQNADESQILTYKSQITILPYTPEEISTMPQAYSGANYDLLNSRYNANQSSSDNYIVKDDNINKLYITKILDEKGNDITASIISGAFSPTGYSSGTTEPNCVIEFSEIIGESKTIYVEYTITYKDLSTYAYLCELVLKNRQSITIQYPESDLVLSGGEFVFLSGYDQDALNIMGGGTKTDDGVYEIANQHYEPMLIYTDSFVELNFVQANNAKKVSRATVTNAENIITSNSTSTDLKITPIAYQKDTGVASGYVSNIIVNNDNQISFAPAGLGLCGTIIFKLETASGNVGYYFVYVYCNGSVNSVNATNNMEVIAYQNANHAYITDTLFTKVQIGSGIVTYSELVTYLYNNTDWLNTFKITYNPATTSLYLYNGVATGDEFTYNKQWVNVDEETITSNAFFNTITIGLVYQSGTNHYSYGTITIYVQPNQVVSVTNANFAKPNGEFTAEITANETLVSSPFGTNWDAEIVSVNGEEYTGSSYETVGSELKIYNRVSEEKVIRVKYECGNTIAYVNYTYKATVIPTQEYLNSNPITVGNFNAATKEFNNTLEVKGETFFGTYLGDFDVDIIEGLVGYDNGILTFTQTTEQQSAKIKITYNDYETKPTREFTFVIKPGVYVVETSGDDFGLTSTKRKNTTKNTTYNSKVGSTLELVYDDTTNPAYMYSVGGLTIYTNEASKLNITFGGNGNYVVNNDSVLDKDGSVEIAGTQNVEFVHLADNKTIDLTVKVLNNTSGSEYTERKFYINVVPTYSKLKSTYLTDGANHENVPSGDEIEYLHNVLLSGTRLKLLDATGADIDSAVLSDMGFADYPNPNYIEFSVNANANIITSSKSVDIKFITANKNADCTLILKNKAGMSECYYDYQIMAGNYVDGLDFTSTNGIYNESGKYVSFLLEDFDANINTFTSNKMIIGSMLDLRNENTFSLDAISVGGITITDKSKKIISDGKYVGEYTSVIGEYENGIQYIVEYNYMKFYITFDTDYKTIELIGQRTGADLTPDLIINLTAGGVNGEGTLVSELKIVIKNCKIESKFESSIDTSIYSGYEIDLNNKVTTNSTETLSYTLAGGTYTVDGKQYTITKDDTKNNLFSFNSGKIQTNAVGSDVYASVKFDVSVGGYVVKQVNYNFNVYLNMQFVANGEAIEEAKGKTYLETNFVLTKDNTNPIIYPKTINFKNTSEMSTSNKEGDYYNVLVFDLYMLKVQGSNNSRILPRNSVVVELHSAISCDILVVNNNSGNPYIQFKKDYTGDLELKLSVSTDNGVYYIIWTIHVFGIIDLNYSSAEPEFARLTNSALPFNPGTKQKMINALSGTGVGLIMKNAPKFTISPTNDYQAENVKVTAYYQYNINTINDYTTILSNKELFNLNHAQYTQTLSGLYNVALTTNSLEIMIPSVPTTTLQEQQAYFVTFKIYIEYLGLANANANKTVDEFYITYNVINYRQVDTYSYTIGTDQTQYSSANINVDNITANNGNYYLDLFYFEQIFETSKKITYTEGKFKIGNTLYELDTTNSNENTKTLIKQGFADRTYDIENNKLDGIAVSKGASYHTATTGSVNSVFKTDNFNNVFEFAEFINQYNGIAGGVKIGDKAFTLVEIKDGRYGINLAENGKLIDNELCAELSLVKDNVKTITIYPYSETNETGFRLYANNSIKPVTSVSLGEMFLPSYFNAGSSNLKMDNINIIGVGENPNKNWITGVASVNDPISSDAGATINIPSENSFVTYNIYKATYSAGGSNLYNLTATYYYIKASSVVVPDYNAIGIETSRFKINYIPDAENQILNLTKAYKIWKMNASNALVYENPTNVENVTSESSYSGYDATYLQLNADKNKLSISSSVLDEHKLRYPNENNYPMITINVEVVDGVTLRSQLEFALHYYPKVNAKYYITTTEDVIVDLTNNLYIPINGAYEKLDSSNKGNIKYVNEISDGQFANYNDEEAKIIISKDKLNAYFTENPDKTNLYITFRLVVDDSNTLDFQVVVKKQAFNKKSIEICSFLLFRCKNNITQSIN